MVLHQLKEGPLPVEKPTCGQMGIYGPFCRMTIAQATRPWAVLSWGLRAPGTRLVITDYSIARLLLYTHWILNLALEGLETLRLYRSAQAHGHFW